LRACQPQAVSVGAFRPTSLVLVSDRGYVGVEPSKHACLRSWAAIASSSSSGKVSHGRVPSGSEHRRNRTGEIDGAAPTTEVDLLIAPSSAFADLPIECDCPHCLH